MGDVNLTIQTGDGETATIPSSKVVTDLKAKGVASSLSPAGDMLYYQLDGQPMEMPVSDFVSQAVGPVTSIGFDPTNTDYSTVDPEMRLAIENLPDDGLRRKYIETILQGEGFESPTIIGSGSDWAFFDETTGTYNALTNEPGWDWSDIGEVGARGVPALGSILGGTLGTAAGGGFTPAGVGLGAAGSGVGGQLGRAAVDAYLAAGTDNYTDFLGNLSEEELATIGNERLQNAAMDTLFGGVASGIGYALPSLGKGLVTRGGAAASGAVSGGSNVLRKGARTLDTDFGQQLGADVVFKTGPAQTYAFGAQVPSWLIRNIPKGVKYAKTKMGLVDDAAKGVAEEAVSRVRPPSMMERWHNVTMRSPRGGDLAEETSSEILERTGHKIGRRIDDFRDSLRAPKNAGTTQAAEKGMSRFGTRTSTKGPISWTRAGQNFGRVAGNVADSARDVGRLGEEVIGAGMSGIYKGVNYGLAPVQYGAKGFQKGFQSLQPLEYRGYSAFGSRLSEE